MTEMNHRRIHRSRSALCLCLLITAACADDPVDAPPNDDGNDGGGSSPDIIVEILEPMDGAEWTALTGYPLRGTATNADGDDLSSGIGWAFRTTSFAYGGDTYGLLAAGDYEIFAFVPNPAYPDSSTAPYISSDSVLVHVAPLTGELGSASRIIAMVAPVLSPSHLAVLETSTGELRTVDVEIPPPSRGFGISPDASSIYVSGGDFIYVVDVASEAVVQEIPTGGFSVDLVITPDGSTAFITRSPGIFALDLATGAISDTALAPLPLTGSRLALAPDGGTLYAFWGPTDPDEVGRALAIDAATHELIADTAIGPGEVTDIAFAPDAGRVLLARRVFGDSLLTRIDAYDVASNAVAGALIDGQGLGDVRNVAFRPGTSRFWFTGRTARYPSMHVFDSGSEAIVRTIPIATAFFPVTVQRTDVIAFSPDGAWAYVAMADGHLAVIDAAAGRMTALLEIGGTVHAIVALP